MYALQHFKYKKMNKTLLTLAIAITSLGVVSCQNKANDEAKEQTTTNIAERVDNARFSALMTELPDEQLIDVRTPGEYAAGAIGNATNIDFMNSDFAQQIEKLDKTKPVMIYCQSGGRSGKALKQLNEMGFKTVYELKTGYGGWPKE